MVKSIKGESNHTSDSKRTQCLYKLYMRVRTHICVYVLILTQYENVQLLSCLQRDDGTDMITMRSLMDISKLKGYVTSSFKCSLGFVGSCVSLCCCTVILTQLVYTHTDVVCVGIRYPILLFCAEGVYSFEFNYVLLHINFILSLPS